MNLTRFGFLILLILTVFSDYSYSQTAQFDDITSIISYSSDTNNDGEKQYGKLANPTICPVNKHLVAYERFKGTSRETFIVNRSLPQDNPEYLIQINAIPAEDRPEASLWDFGAQSSRTTEGFNGQFAWCPAQYPQGIYYVFIADGGKGNLDLYLGKVGDSIPIRLTELPGSEQNPSWSSDGRKIIFTGESKAKTGNTIYLLEGLHHYIASGILANLTLKELLTDERMKVYPCFSPSGKFIAFGAEGSLDKDDASFGIEVLDISGNSRPLRITANTQTDEFLPSWRTDGKMLAYYITNRNAEAAPMIGLSQLDVEVKYNKISGVLSTTTIKQDVIKNENIGPCWIQKNNAIIAVAKKETEANPIFIINIKENAEELQYSVLEPDYYTSWHSDITVMLSSDSYLVTYADQAGTARRIITAELITSGMTKLSIYKYYDTPFSFAKLSLMPYQPKAGYDAASDWFKQEYAYSGDGQKLQLAKSIQRKGNIASVATYSGYATGLALIASFVNYNTNIADTELDNPDTRSTWEQKYNSQLIGGVSLMVASYLINFVYCYLNVPSREYLDIVNIQSSSEQHLALKSIEEPEWKMELNIKF